MAIVNNLNAKKGQYFDLFLAIKGLAILSVIIAHIFPDDLIVGCMNKTLLLYIFEKLATLGVPCFLFISGFLFFQNQDLLIIFFKKRIKSIYVPWFVLSTLVFFIGGISGFKTRVWNLNQYFQYIIGIGTIYYYITVLTFLFGMFFIFKYFKFDSKFIAIVCLIVSLLTVHLYSIIDITIYYGYLNPLTWIFFFGFGFYTADKGTIELIRKKFSNIKLIGVCIYILSIIALGAIDYHLQHYAYFSVASLLIELLTLLLLIGLVNTNMTFLNMLGKYSFTIYLIHLPFASVTLAILRKFHILNFPLNLLAIFTSISFIIIIIKSLEKLQLYQLLTIIGCRTEKY